MSDTASESSFTLDDQSNDPLGIPLTCMNRGNRAFWFRCRSSPASARERGRHGGRPKVFDDDMIAYAGTLRARGVPVPDIARKLIIPTGKNKGHNPSVASVYRILAANDGAPT
ncbi:hypothetical protein [Streptosporangium roseum]|uniref:hypothetical protein n=1 Tax=Streptosporangium roseum TaxID=2001 RepID=UPI00331D9256